MSRLLIFSILLLTTSLQSSSVYGFCSAIQEENVAVTKRHVPPYTHLVRYPPLSNVTEMNYQNIFEVYTSVVERHQSATTLKNIMARRIGRDFPTPNQHHCFIQERNESLFLYNPATATDNHTARLIEDTVVLYNASKALQMMANYERQSNISTTNNLTVSFQYLKHSLDNIIDSLSNMTGVSVRESQPIGLVDGSDENPPSSTNRDSDNENDESSATTYNSNNRISYTPPPTPATVPTTPNDDPRSGDGDYFNQARMSSHHLGIGRPIARTRHNRQARSAQSAPFRDQCMTIENDEDEFVVMYEIWIAMWYVQSDLLKIRDYISPN